MFLCLFVPRHKTGWSRGASGDDQRLLTNHQLRVRGHMGTFNLLENVSRNGWNTRKESRNRLFFFLFFWSIVGVSFSITNLFWLLLSLVYTAAMSHFYLVRIFCSASANGSSERRLYIVNRESTVWSCFVLLKTKLKKHTTKEGRVLYCIYWCHYLSEKIFVQLIQMCTYPDIFFFFCCLISVEC